MYKRLWITVNQTDGLGVCFEEQYEPCNFQKVTASSPSETLIKAGCAKMSGMPKMSGRSIR